jgi:ADP-heptose:LPS heptosyltransferase
MGAMGDVIRLEPVMRYFHDTGHMVVLHTSNNFYNLFINHDYKIHNIHLVDGRLLKNAKHYDLDMSYENNPQVPHLISYFEACGVCEDDYKKYLTKQKLSLGFQVNQHTKLFNKYVVLHIDDRPQASRNIYGVDWQMVAYELKRNGYDLIQVGFQNKEIIGTMHMRTINENLLSYLVAGADMFIGIDSGISHIAAGFNIPSMIFFGNVNPDIIHVDLDNIVVVTNHNQENPICEKPYCWHSVVGCAGVPCYINESSPPCSSFSTKQVINFIKLMK